MLNVNYKGLNLTPITSLTLPLGIDKSQYNIRKHPHYSGILSESKDRFKEVTKNIDLFCFYCGTKTHNFVPAFLHETSGKNIWLVGDLRSGSVICNECNRSYGLSNIRYLDHVIDIPSYQSGNLKKLLSFEPEVLIPSLEPAHQHFRYNNSGYLHPLTHRAERTINAFNLNRKLLVERRLKSIQEFIYSSNPNIKEYLESPFDILFCRPEFYVDESNMYNRRKIQSTGKVSIESVSIESENFNKNSPLYKIPMKREIIPYEPITFQKLLSKKIYDFSDNFSGISSFTFSGIRGFHNGQKVTFLGKGSTVILGENGVGKSTFLELFKRAMKKKNKRSLEDICSKGNNIIPSYTISYNGFEKEQVYIERESTRIKRSDCNLIHISDSRVSNVAIKNLIRWINSKRNDQDIIDWIANKLSSLLELSSDHYFNTVDGEVFWTVDNKNYSSNNKVKSSENSFEKRILIDELSSGYNSILFIFYEMMTSISKQNQSENLKDINLRLSSSIVLIDEIELHLHPKFKKRIIRNIQDAFPEVIFIFTTHDPLVIKSINDETRLIRFERINGKTVINDNLPDPRGLSTEQILTSPHFGLDTIDDNDLQPLIDRYNLEIKNKNWEIVSEIRMSLFKMGYFGKTYRELIALSAVDAYFRDGKNPSTEEIVEVLRRKDSSND